MKLLRFVLPLQWGSSGILQDRQSSRAQSSSWDPALSHSSTGLFNSVLKSLLTRDCDFTEEWSEITSLFLSRTVLGIAHRCNKSCRHFRLLTPLAFVSFLTIISLILHLFLESAIISVNSFCSQFAFKYLLIILLSEIKKKFCHVIGHSEATVEDYSESGFGLRWDLKSVKVRQRKLNL